MGFPLFSQENLSILVEGPRRERGIEFLGPNIISHYYAEYESNETTVYIYYTQEPVVVSDSWQRERCFEHTTLRFSEQNDDFYFITDEDWGNLFLEFPQAHTTPCLFIDIFIERFEYFRNLSGSVGGIPFPAILRMSD